MRYRNSRQDLQLGPVTSSLIVLRHETKEYHYFHRGPAEAPASYFLQKYNLIFMQYARIPG